MKKGTITNEYTTNIVWTVQPFVKVECKRISLINTRNKMTTLWIEYDKTAKSSIDVKPDIFSTSNLGEFEKIVKSACIYRTY
jgi:hypothetical protein